MSENCPICRFPFDSPCPRCTAQGEQTTKNCPVVRGKCGHKYHKHCVQDWIENHDDSCPYPGCGKKWTEEH